MCVKFSYIYIIMSAYNKIFNPKTNRYVNINGNTGRKVLKNYLMNFQSGGRVTYPSEYFGTESGRYSEAVSGTRNSAGGETVGNGFDIYKPNSQKGGRVTYPSEYFGTESGRYSEAVSGTRNSAGGETVGNGFDIYKPNSQKGGRKKRYRKK
jgi:hypothetical protein